VVINGVTFEEGTSTSKGVEKAIDLEKSMVVLLLITLIRCWLMDERH